MARYVSRDIKDRIATGDNCFIMEDLGNGRIRLTPDPDSVTEAGTPINKELLQLMEDRIVYLMNLLTDDVSGYPFSLSFATLSGVTTDGIWNVENERIEC